MASGGWQPVEGKAEVGETDEGYGKRGGGCLDLGTYILGGGPVRDDIRVEDVGDDPVHRESFGRISPQGGPQADGEASLVGEEQCVDIPSAGGRDGWGGPAGGGDLHL